MKEQRNDFFLILITIERKIFWAFLLRQIIINSWKPSLWLPHTYLLAEGAAPKAEWTSGHICCASTSELSICFNMQKNSKEHPVSLLTNQFRENLYLENLESHMYVWITTIPSWLRSEGFLYYESSPPNTDFFLL